ncbi:nucleotide-binding domain-containing protein [Rhodotorula sp. JG-1b]|nr:nucleotide-binding domain-containing protein [Rhodotorula sp. JG-1b]
MTKQSAVVVGAGVVGLSTAIRLLEAGYKVDIVARDLPGDPLSIEYTSPWAGAHHVSVATGADMRLHEFDARTFKVMSELIEQDPHVPLYFATQREYREEPEPTGEDAALSQLSLMSRYHPDFRWLDPSELPEGTVCGATFTCILIHTPVYLTYLLDRVKSLGGRVHRCGALTSLSDAFEVDSSLARADVLLNCTGLGARRLVPDPKVFPTRGQLVIVNAPWVTEGKTRLGPARDGQPRVYDYTIPRPKTGHVVLGGCAEKDNWDPRPRADMSRRIKERCLALEPELLPPNKRGGTIDDLEVVQEAVGLRPTREGGIRIEADTIDNGRGVKIPLVHNYGHGGYGFQSSWATAEAAVDLVKTVLAREITSSGVVRTARL